MHCAFDIDLCLKSFPSCMLPGAPVAGGATTAPPRAAEQAAAPPSRSQATPPCSTEHWVRPGSAAVLPQELTAPPRRALCQRRGELRLRRRRNSGGEAGG